jgi:deazaflavin-dependent oxidoreductase (nitroreductase family)
VAVSRSTSSPTRVVRPFPRHHPAVFDRLVVKDDSSRLIGSLGATRVAVWAIKLVVAPVHRFVYGATGGRVFRFGKRNRSILSLTTTGRQTGRARTTPVFFLRDADRFVVCNVNPGSERTNPWVLNLRSNPIPSVQVGPDVVDCRAREAEGAELQRCWPRFVALWPATASTFGAAASAPCSSSNPAANNDLCGAGRVARYRILRADRRELR